jgi:hypothetical protein
MTDREMVELAAKAIGISGYRYSENFSCMAHWNETDGGWFDSCGLWDPLADDGDAFRLAVKLKLDVDIRENYSRASSRDVTWAEDAGLDQCKCTRRAIVIAAAKVGEGMK